MVASILKDHERVSNTASATGTQGLPEDPQHSGALAGMVKVATFPVRAPVSLPPMTPPMTPPRQLEPSIT